MIKNKLSSMLKDSEIKKINFFHDFIVFLEYLEKQPIKKTARGNISLYDINKLGDIFHQRKAWDEHAKFGWKITSERDVEVITQIKILAKINHLTYDRKDKLLISRAGKDFLRKLTPTEQFTTFVLAFWRKVNWDYFSSGKEILGMSVTEVPQENQLTIWDMLLNYGGKWIDYSEFCETIKNVFHLEPYYNDEEDYQYSLFSDIEYGLIYKNLARFVCVEIEEKPMKYGIKQISKFRPTKAGLYLFKFALEEDLQSFLVHLFKDSPIAGHG